jgi:NitT/TauT family transport system permease protein
MRAINLRPSGTWRLALALLPFLLLLLAYVIGSNVRLAANPNDKLLPSFADMGETIYAYAFEPDPRTGVYLLWADTAASLTRLLIGLAISAGIALVIGVLIGLLPFAGRHWGRSSPCFRWCRRWRCCPSSSSSWASAKPRRSR